MRHVFRSAKICAVLLFVILIITTALFFNSCKKDSKKLPEKEDSEIATKKPGTGKLPGPCPYECHDPACFPYSDYCGGGAGCPSGFVYCSQASKCFPNNVGCNSNGKNDTWVFNSYGVTSTFYYNLSANGGDTTLKVSLIIKDNQTTIDYGVLRLTSQNVRNKDSLSLLLRNLYSNIFERYGINILRSYSVYPGQMVTAVSDTMAADRMRSLVFQSFCMYVTLSRAANRDNTQTGDINFSIIDSYINGSTSFSCEEDEYINIPMFKSYLTNLKTTSTDPGIDYYLGALANETSTSLNIVEITERLNTYFNQSTARWPQGGECGCCFNYSGPCLYWNKICLLHDYQCQACYPRGYCLPGCVPSSCKGNTIAWYWWLIG